MTQDKVEEKLEKLEKNVQTLMDGSQNPHILLSLSKAVTEMQSNLDGLASGFAALLQSLQEHHPETYQRVKELMGRGDD